MSPEFGGGGVIDARVHVDEADGVERLRARLAQTTSEKGDENHTGKTTRTDRRLTPIRSGDCQVITVLVQL